MPRKKSENATAEGKKSLTVSERLGVLETGLAAAWKVLRVLAPENRSLERIEEDMGVDIDRDGYVGAADGGHSRPRVLICMLLVSLMGVMALGANVEVDRWTDPGDESTEGIAYIYHNESGDASLVVNTLLASNDLTVIDDATITDDLTVSGLATITETLGVTGETTMTGGGKVDTLSELTAAAGVTADSVQCKDAQTFASGTDGTHWYAQAPLAVLPISYFEYFDDFDSAEFKANAAGAGGKFDETADVGEWLVTVTDGDTDNGESITAADSADGGWIKFVNNNAASDQLNCQKNGECIKVETGEEVWFATRFSIEDVDQADVYIGLGDTDTDVPGSLPNDHLLFFADAGVLKFSYEQANTNTTVTLNAAISDHAAFTNAVTCAFHSDGAGEFYVYSGINGSALTFCTNLGASANVVYPQNDLTPTIAVKALDTGADDTFVDYIWAKKERKY